MLPVAIALLVLGVVLGFLFPVMFVAAAAGLVLLIVFFVGGARRAETGEVGTGEMPADRPE